MFNPWDTVPEYSVYGETKRKLVVMENGGWGITMVKGNRYKGIRTLAMGYNADFAKNGETKKLKKGKWVDGDQK